MKDIFTGEDMRTTSNISGSRVVSTRKVGEMAPEMGEVNCLGLFHEQPVERKLNGSNRPSEKSRSQFTPHNLVLFVRRGRHERHFLGHF